MEEELKDDSGLDQYTQKRVEDGIQELQDEAELKIKWKKEITANVAFQKYLEGFNGASVESFITSYINYKYNWIKYGSMYKRNVESEQSKWIDLAHEHLEPILQKQLFDLQCLWRAEKIELEGVQISFDFRVWEKNIYNCPFLQPITIEDIEMYQEYLLKEDFDDYRYHYREEWQDYNEIKENFNATESDLPGWYGFHNLRTGNSKLFLLPDLRGGKEAFYLSLNRQENAKNAVAVSTVPMDTRPYLSIYDEEKVAFIVKEFDDKATQQGHYYTTEANRGKENEEHYEGMLSELLSANELVPIRGHNDIKEALEIAYKEYRGKKIAEHMPIAFQQYLFNKQMGLATEERDPYYKDLRKMYEENILKGRVLNGESRDFNF